MEKQNDTLGRSRGRDRLSVDSCAPGSTYLKHVHLFAGSGTVYSRRAQAERAKEEAHGSTADGSFVSRLFQMVVFPVSSLSQLVRMFRERLKAKGKHDIPSAISAGSQKLLGENVGFEEAESPANLKEIPAMTSPQTL